MTAAEGVDAALRARPKEQLGLTNRPIPLDSVLTTKQLNLKENSFRELIACRFNKSTDNSYSLGFESGMKVFACPRQRYFETGVFSVRTPILSSSFLTNLHRALAWVLPVS